MIKILFVTANPSSTERLRLDDEVREIDAALRSAEHRDEIELVSHWAVRIDDLQGLLLRHRPQIVHFSGHGSAASEIVLQDQNGNGVTVPPAALSDLFRLFRDTVQCVVLNACYSEPQADAIGTHIGHVVGMSSAISDEAARNFAVGFYRALGYRTPFAQAFEFGVSQLRLLNLPESELPVLLTNESIQENALLDSGVAAHRSRARSPVPSAPGAASASGARETAAQPDAVEFAPPQTAPSKAARVDATDAGEPARSPGSRTRFSSPYWMGFLLLPLLILGGWWFVQNFSGGAGGAASFPTGQSAGVTADQTSVPTSTPEATPTTTPQPTRTPVAGWSSPLPAALRALDGDVRVLLIDGDTLYVGGQFKNPVPALFALNLEGGTVTDFAPGLQGRVSAAALAAGRLYVGGEFSVQLPEGEEAVRNLAYWEEGAWHPLGDAPLMPGPVTALAVDDAGTVYVGGPFDHGFEVDDESVRVQSLLRWDSRSDRWLPMGAGDNTGVARRNSRGSKGEINDILVREDHVYVGGQFAHVLDRNDGRIPNSRHLARWNRKTESWDEGLALVGNGNGDASVQALAVHDGELYFGGQLYYLNNKTAALLGRLNLTTGEVEAVGGTSFLNRNNGNDGIIYALSEHQNRLLVAGKFYRVNGDGANNVALFRRGSWTRLPSKLPNGATRYGLGDNRNFVYAAAVAPNREIFLGGRFTEADGTPLDHAYLVRWGGEE